MITTQELVSLLLLSVLPLANSSVIRSPSGKSAIENAVANKTQTQNKTQQQVTKVLDRILEAQKGFSDPSLRIAIQLQVADLLWGFDEPRARALFANALKTSEKLANEKVGAPVELNSYSPRMASIKAILQRDPDWASRLAEALGEISNDAHRPQRTNHELLNLQFSLGFYFAQRDAQRAATWARPVVASGDLNLGIGLLSMIRFKDPVSADELFGQLISKAKQGRPTFQDIRRMSDYVFPQFGQGVLRYSSLNGKEQVSPKAPAVAGQFIDLAYEVASLYLDRTSKDDAVSCDAGTWLDFAMLKVLVPYVDRYLSGKASDFRSRVTALFHRVPIEQRECLTLTEPAAIDDVAAISERIRDPKVRNRLIQRAVLQLISNNDFDRAAAMIGKIDDGQMQTSLLSALHRQIDDKRTNDAMRALTESDLDQAERSVSVIRRFDKLMVGMLIGRLAEKDKDRASLVFDEYERRAAEITEPTEKALRSMELAGFAAKIDQNRGFDYLKRAIAEFNSAGFVPELERFLDRELDGTTNAPEKVNIGLQKLLNSWDFRWMGMIDLDRAVALTQLFELKEAAVLVQLSACSGALINSGSASRPSN